MNRTVPLGRCQQQLVICDAPDAALINGCVTSYELRQKWKDEEEGAGRRGGDDDGGRREPKAAARPAFPAASCQLCGCRGQGGPAPARGAHLRTPPLEEVATPEVPGVFVGLLIGLAANRACLGVDAHERKELLQRSPQYPRMPRPPPLLLHAREWSPCFFPHGVVMLKTPSMGFSPSPPP